MTWREFISATIGQLVWPIFIVVIVVLFREPIKTLASSPGLRRVKAGPAGIELEIDRTLSEAKRLFTIEGVALAGASVPG